MGHVDERLKLSPESANFAALKEARFAPKAPSLPFFGRALSARRGNVGALEKIRDDHGDLVWIHIFGGLRVLAFLSADGLETGLRNVTHQRHRDAACRGPCLAVRPATS